MKAVCSIALCLTVLPSLTSCTEKTEARKLSPSIRAQQPQNPTPSTDAQPNPPTDEKASIAPLAIDGPNARTLCKKPADYTRSIETIPDVIALLNALPKPVSVACFIDALDRPLEINANSNIFSGQPAAGSKSPRIFIFRGSRLQISVVPKGDGAKVVEFGYRTDSTNSIKGELKFPVTETLADDAAYTYILKDNEMGTHCFACHPGERQAGEDFPPIAFTSTYVRPGAEFAVPFAKLDQLNKNCAAQKSDECEVIQAIFFQDQAKHREFP